MTNAYSGTRRYLALWFPFLPSDRLRIQEPERFAGSPDAPVALITKMKGALKLAAVDECAQSLGLCAGLTLADARARQPGLTVYEMDEEADKHWLNRMARRCVAYSPLVTTMPPDTIIIDITGADHLFGGEAGLMDNIGEKFAGRGITLRLTCAATAEGAHALARYAQLPVSDERAAIRGLPVTALGLDPQATLALKRAGLKCVGDVAVRPAATIAARFGAKAVTAIRLLTGEVQRPIQPLAQPAPLIFERRFAEPIAHQSMIAYSFLELMQDAACALEERRLGGRRFQLILFRSDGAQRRLDIETGAATRDPALVLRLFDERIGALANPLDPGFGYDSITLTITAAEALAVVQPALDGGENNDEKGDMAIAELIDRLSMRLGIGSIRRIVPHDSHIPEQAQLALPAIECRVPIRWPKPALGEPPARPIFLFDPPQIVEVIAEVPDGPPHRFRWRRTLHEVRLYEGPERIASEWWRRKGGEQSSKAGLTRDYYRIEDVRGRRYWIFRHGLYEEKPNPRWYLHGLFA